MVPKTGSVTQLAMRAITDERILEEKYSLPDAVLDYLQEETNFKSLSALLKETMVKAGCCEENAPNAVFIKNLYGRLAEQDIACGREARSDAAIKRWIGGQTKSIRYREDAVEICFALNLDLELSRNFLNKCGYNSFNVRNAEDATYLYCIINNRPLSAAKSILAKYQNAASGMEEPQEAETNHHSGSTTIILENQLLGGSRWEDDDSFLNTFLIPNREKFIGFTSTALCNYYILKNYLFSTVFITEAKDQEHYVLERKDKDSEIKKADIPVLLACKSALRKYNAAISSLFELYRDSARASDHESLLQSLQKVVSDVHAQKVFPKLLSDLLQKGITQKDISLVSGVRQVLCDYDNHALPVLCSINTTLEENMVNVAATLIAVRNGIISCTDLKSQKQFSRFLVDIRKNEGFLKHVITCIQSNSKRIRKYTESSLKETVMKEFPDDKSFADFEKDPTLFGQGMTIRKVIILMYFVAYAYEYSITLYSEEYTYSSSLFGELGFEPFLNGLNELLDKCHLPKLYPANQFDWLILRSIREFEVSDYAYEEDNPIAFFNDVLAFSFGDELNSN